MKRPAGARRSSASGRGNGRWRRRTALGCKCPSCLRLGETAGEFPATRVAGSVPRARSLGWSGHGRDASTAGGPVSPLTNPGALLSGGPDSHLRRRLLADLGGALFRRRDALEALPQRFHEVDDLRRLLLLVRDDFLALNLRVDDASQLFLVIVLVLRQVAAGLEVADDLARELHLVRLHLGGHAT